MAAASRRAGRMGRLLSGASALSLGLLAWHAGAAQSAEPQTSGELVVTASRAARAGFSAPTR